MNNQPMIPQLQEDILASSIKKCQAQLMEILDAIEMRDVSAEDVKESLNSVANNLRDLRKNKISG